MASAIQARGLGKRFGPVVALDRIDLDVPAGTLLAVLGPNGAGKTTLLRLLAGLARPTSGTLRIGRGGSDRRRTRARVGYIGHATFLYPTLTARENLIFAARLYGVRQPGRRADQLLAEQGLGHVAHRAAGSFSHGMAHRLSIARGLVHDPEVVLLDEPFTGLDGPSADRLTARLRAERDGGRTVVLVTHDLRRACTLADSAIVLARGRVIRRETGPIEIGKLEQALLEALGASP